MGFIPVFLAIFGFASLFLGVVYHSLRRARARVQTLAAAQPQFTNPADQARLAQNLLVARQRYNKLVAEVPYKFVALMFRFKPA